MAKSTEETDFEFIFIKSVRTDFNEEMCKIFDCMVFFCQPSVLKVGGPNAAILNVQLKVDVERLQEQSHEMLR